MDHVLGGQVVAARGLGISGGASCQLAALLQQPRAGGSMNGSIYAASAQQRVVSGVDDGIHRHLCDIAAQGADFTNFFHAANV